MCASLIGPLVHRNLRRRSSGHAGDCGGQRLYLRGFGERSSDAWASPCIGIRVVLGTCRPVVGRCPGRACRT
eukprot:14288641-Alexandrium_andersonii.AAC.1